MVVLQLLNKILKTKSLDIAIKNELSINHFQGYEEKYQFILDHYKKYGNVPDIATFLDKFNDFEIIDVTETDDYLIKHIKDDFLYARLVPIITKGADLMSGDASEALDYLKSNLNNILSETNIDGVDITKQANLRYDVYMSKLNNPDKPWCYPTGFKELDEIIGGISQGEEFIVIVARTNQGKSWVLGKILTHSWKMGLNVGYISPEMSAEKIGYRFDTLNEHYSNTAMLRGKELNNYGEYIEDLTKSKNQFRVATPVDFDRRITVSKLRNFIQRNNIDILGIDGITYLSDERGGYRDNKTTSLTNISEDLMSLSVELKVPIITVVQANRSAVMNGDGQDNDTPELESIRDSDGISHNATKILSIRQVNDKLKIAIKKNRDGRVGDKLSYNWKIDTGEFEYNPNVDEYSEKENTENKFNRRTKKHEPVINKQPLVSNSSNNDGVLF